MVTKTRLTKTDTLAGLDRRMNRPDLDIDEIKAGQDYFMWRKENSVASGMVFSGRFKRLSRRRFVFEQVNLSASNILLARILAPREYETTLFLAHEAGDVWRYYSLTRFGAAESPLSEAELASVVNRSVAVYRHLAGVPTDREPPAAP